MAISTSSSWRHDLHTIFNAGTLAGLTDGQLLERIAALRGAGASARTELEAAFALLFDRHGPMVLRVCRSVLGDVHDADDAFQATFLVLLRQAGSIRKYESVGPWLHGVARRVAACARSNAARRQAHERRYSELRRRTTDGHSISSDPRDFDLSHTIHAELDRLPERYRAPIILCDLEERSLDEAAHQLGWPLGTVKSRLNRGRQRLRERLVRRGIAPQLVPLAMGGFPIAHPPSTAVSLFPLLAEAMSQFLEHGASGGRAVPAPVLSLIRAQDGVFFMGRPMIATVALCFIGLAALGIGKIATGSRHGARDDIPSQAQAPTVATPNAKTVDGKDQKPDPAAMNRSRSDVDSHVETIDVSGRATDRSGRPVAGAKVYVLDTNQRSHSGKSRLLATVTTDQNGIYTASRVELTVWKPNPSPIPSGETGRFQVAATAPGFGFTWHESTDYRPVPRPRAAAGPEPKYAKAFHRGEPIVVDLSFGPSASLTGRIVDDRGRPLAAVKVQVGCCDDPRRLGVAKMWSCARVDPAGTTPRERLALDGIYSLPQELLSAHTDADGRYQIDGLPREAQFLTSIDPGPEYEPLTETVATTDRPLQSIKSLGHSAVLNHTFAAPREVALTVLYSETRLPAKGATVRARSDRELLRAGGVGTIDDSGRATLRLRPGQHEIAIEPPVSAPYLPGRLLLKVGPDDATKTASFTLEPAAILTLEAIDAKTGAGIEGVHFQYETDATRERRDLASQLVVLDHPATDSVGRLIAFVEPGRRRFFVKSVPPGWEFERSNDEFIELAAGHENTARFAFTKRAQPDDKATGSGTSAIFPDNLVETWRKQERLTRTGKFWVHQYHLESAEPVTWADLEAFLNSTDMTKVSDLVSAIRAKFPGFRDPGALTCQVIADGPRLRNICRYRPGHEISVIVANGSDTTSYHEENAQANVYSRGGERVIGTSDICFRPNLTVRPVRPEAKTAAPPTVERTTEANGLLTVKVKSRMTAARWVVDPTTGFVHALSQATDADRSSREVRQIRPKAFGSGAVLPAVIIDATCSSGRVSRVWIRSIENVDLAYQPSPLDFAVSVPAGTVVLDYREDQAHPKQGMTRYTVPDLITFANGLTSRNRSIDPVLKPGQPAPAIRPTSWLDQNGMITPPDLAGKVVLIDFWGIGCGPCVAELPEVQTAYDHLNSRNHDFMMIGLHDSGATVEQVAKFAVKRGLTYPIAIDRPTGETGWFGATFKEYGVRAIPAAAVIDRQGKITFVGRFNEALQKAADLLSR